MTAPAHGSPEREALAQRIAEHRAAEAELARIVDAERRLDDPSLYLREAEAEAALAEAKKAMPARLIAEALGEAPPPGATVAEAEAQLAAVQREGEEKKAARALIAGRREEAALAYQVTDARRQSAIAAVVAASPEAARLISELTAAQRRLTDLRRALRAINFLLPYRAWTDYALEAMPDWPDLVLAPQWRAATEALKVDAHAPLPAIGAA